MDKKINLAFIKAISNKVVERKLSDWQRDGQTIYGDLNDWARDNYCDTLTSDEREELVRQLIAQYVIQHPYCLQKTYIVLQESNVDGEIVINAVPCMSLEAARVVLINEVNTILRESYHFGGRSIDEFEVEKDDNRFYISDPADDYYEEIKIIEKNIVI